MYPMWKPYVPVAQRRLDAAREMRALTKKGIPVSPILIQGRAIASSVWGKAWCCHVENYSDYANRLPRGRTYVRNGSVVDLQISPGTIMARVQGSSLYSVTISVTKMGRADWQKLCGSCAGGIDSLVELLQGRLSTAVMARLCHQTEGMFPTSRQMTLDCSCPDDATLCKHLAAVLYGIGARLDRQPELLFLLRQVDASELLSSTGAGLAGALAPATTDRVLVADDLSALFGVEMDEAARPTPPTRGRPHSAAAARAAVKRTTASKGTEPAIGSAAHRRRIAEKAARILPRPTAMQKQKLTRKLPQMTMKMSMKKPPKTARTKTTR